MIEGGNDTHLKTPNSSSNEQTAKLKTYRASFSFLSRVCNRIQPAAQAERAFSSWRADNPQLTDDVVSRP